MTKLLLLLAAVMAVTVPAVSCQNDDLQSQVDDLMESLEEMKKAMGALARQTMVQRFALEEKTRYDGDSGIVVVRGNNKGPQNYFTSTHVGGSAFASVHDHSNSERTMGMGEVVAVLNGVEFRTRHNDYKLVMASTSSTDYHATEPLPFPEVPRVVTDLDDVDDQIQEMRKWFKAFKDQDHSVRDYRKYFKPALCYMEGTWTQGDAIDEPFESDRHQLDARTWFQLMEKVRYNSYTGTKNRLENFAYLPTAIMSVNETTGSAQYAQWNYRILCAPIKEDIPTSELKQVDDLSSRYPRKKTMEEAFYTRTARFRLSESNSFQKHSKLDTIMEAIPGKDNIPGELREDTFGESMFNCKNTSKELNAGYYHRCFKMAKPGAMGITTVARGFNDENMWVAKTTQEKVASMTLKVCKRRVCQTVNNRFSYAIPLEIVYLTPLLSWNPYNFLRHSGKGAAGNSKLRGAILNGTDPLNHFLTPAAFFKGKTDRSDPADTVKNAYKVRDQDDVIRSAVASGTRIILPEIEGVGKMRLRYPIAPVHGEGNSVSKEVNALRDLIFEQGVPDNGNDEGGDDEGGDDNPDDMDGEMELPAIIDFTTSDAKRPTEHHHNFQLTKEQYLMLKDSNNNKVTVTTSQGAGHTHELVIRYNRKKGFQYIKCGNQSKCWDGHPRKVYQTLNTIS